MTENSGILVGEYSSIADFIPQGGLRPSEEKRCFIVNQLENGKKGNEAKIIFTRRRRESIAAVLC